jgi:lipopolysaccharide transport system ATP-binding protein
MVQSVISLDKVSKSFKRYKSTGDRVRDLLLHKSSRGHEFWALKDVDLNVGEGHTIGILGRNGSGKSTLLQIVVGTMRPTSGTVQVNGRVSALLELGTGFNPEFTGRQNVFYNGRILGLTQGEMEARFDDIAAFADIGDFLEYPVKTYSSGMYIRLAFSVAISVNPKILIIDEALAVGDARFQQKCISRIKRLREDGVSILFVSHDSDAVRRLCDHAIVLEHGKVVNHGSAVNMSNWYLSLMSVNFDLERQKMIEQAAIEQDERTEDSDLQVLTPLEELDLKQAETVPDTALDHKEFENEFKYYRHGDGAARINRILIRNSAGELTGTVFMGETVSVEFYVDFYTDQESHILGFYLRDRLGTDIIGLNTFQERVRVPPVHVGERVAYRFTFRIDARPGVYGISPGLAYNQIETRYLDWIDNAEILRVSDPDTTRTVFGVYLPPQRRIKIWKALNGENESPGSTEREAPTSNTVAL